MAAGMRAKVDATAAHFPDLLPIQGLEVPPGLFRHADFQLNCKLPQDRVFFFVRQFFAMIENGKLGGVPVGKIIYLESGGFFPQREVKLLVL